MLKLRLNKTGHVTRMCFALLLILLFTSMFTNIGYAATQIEITVDSSKVIGVNNFSVGFQLDGPDIRIWRDRSALRQLAEEANFKLVRFFEHRLGKPCTYWDESTKTGRWDWRDLDLLIQRIFESGAEPLIPLGFIGYDSRRLTSVPRGMSYDRNTGLPYPDQWAAYCAEWVRHFKEVGFPVRYYEMINEAYHYFGWPATQPKLGYFMNLYNAAARAMRSVNSNVKIGNDACILKTVLNYFISNGEDLDFLSYHAYGSESLSTTDAEIFNAAETKYIGETRNVYGVDKTRQLYRTARGIDLPVIHAENNLSFHFTEGTDPRIQKMQGAIYNALVFRTSMLKNFYYNVYFHFASSASQEQRNPSGGRGFGMVNSDDNQPWYPYYAHEMLGSNLAVGDLLVESNSDSSDIRVVPWIHEDKLNVLLICKVDQQRTVYLRGLTGQLDYLKIDNTISWRTPRIQSGTIYASNPLTINGYTVMLLQAEVSTPPPPPPPTSYFNDDFESQDFSRWTGTTTSSGESATVVDYLPYRGNYHGRFTSNGGGNIENAYSYKVIDEDELYARGYFYVARSLPLADNEDRFYFLRFRADGQSVAGAGIRRNGGVDQWIIYARDGSSWIGPVYASSPIVEEDRWYCIELHWNKDSSHGLAEIYVDAVKVLEVGNINTAYFGNADEVDFGLISATNIQNDLIVYGDSFALSNTYIGPQADVTVFEDDFESGDFSKWTGTSTSSGETATVRDYTPHHGTFHGRFTSDGNGGTEYSYCYKAIDEQELYARGYFYVARGLPLADNSDRFYFLRFRSSSQSLAGAGIRQNGGVNSWIVYARDGSSWIGPVYASPPSIRAARWYCIELHLKQHVSQGLVELYVNGEQVLEITGIDTSYFGNVETINFGLISATNVQNSLIVYGDCFAASNTYIGPEPN